MAYINFTINEILNIFKKNADYNRDRIRSISVVNQNQLELLISIGQFFPDIKVTLVYSRYENGKIYFNVLSNGGIKMLMGLVSEMGGKNQKDYITADRNNLIVDCNKLLADNIEGMTVKDISVVGEQLYVTVSVI